MVKIKRVAIKIFISYLIIVFLSIVLILTLFRTFVVDSMMRKTEHYNKLSRYAITELIKNSFSFECTDLIKGNVHIKEKLKNVFNDHSVISVVTKSDNSILLHPFEDYLPEKYRNLINNYEELTDHRKKFPYPVKLNLKNNDNKEIFIYLFFEDPDEGYNQLIFYLLLIVLIFIVSYNIYLIAKRITRPLDKFKDVIAKVASGDFSETVQINSHDEFEEVADVFNKMTSKIEESIIHQKELSANISHELRSPLTRIKVAKQIIGDLDSEQIYKTYLDSIDNEIDGMDKLIDAILNYLKIESSNRRLQQQLDLVELVALEYDKNYLAFIHKKIDCSKEISVDHFAIIADPHINTVFTNIFTNAFKYTPEEGVFSMKIYQQESNIVFSFYNTMKNSEEIINPEKFFEPFYRGSQVKGEKGTGLGLSISRKICEQYGGLVKCEIEENGIEFKVIFSKNNNC